MADHGVALVPTMTVFDSFLRAPEDVDLGVSREQVERLRDANRRSVQLAAKAGVAVACGGNTGMALQAHGSNARELQLLSGAGLPAEQVLAAATTVAGAAVGSGERVGRIEPGYVGDVIAVETDSLSEAISSVDSQHLQLVVQARDADQRPQSHLISPVGLPRPPRQSRRPVAAVRTYADRLLLSVTKLLRDCWTPFPSRSAEPTDLRSAPEVGGRLRRRRSPLFSSRVSGLGR
jgi:hypothetical protein